MLRRPPTSRTGDVGAPPPPPPAEIPVDEGPMRRELLRQIAFLETELSARSRTWRRTRVTPLRGPAVQTGRDLERIRDELLAELARR